MIDVLKKDYGVRVVKKPVGKSSQKSVQGLNGRGLAVTWASAGRRYQWQCRRANDEAKFERVVDLVKEQRLRQPRLGRRKLHHLIRPTLAAEDLMPYSISCAGIVC